MHSLIGPLALQRWDSPFTEAFTRDSEEVVVMNTMNTITQPQPDSELVWPENFLKGVALSVFQNSGDGKSNWTDYIKAKNYLGQRQNAAAFEKAADFWEM